jgi:hypothetical protein
MKKHNVLSLGIVLALACPGLAGQSAPTIPKAGKMIKAMSLTGCVERDASGAFALTHVTSKLPARQAPTASADHAGMGDALRLMGSSVDFSTRVGQRVTVKGARDGDTFTAKTVKMVSSSCS